MITFFKRPPAAANHRRWARLIGGKRAGRQYPRDGVFPLLSAARLPNHPARQLAGWLLAVCCAVLVGCLAGCSLVQSTVTLPFRAVKAVLPGGAETEPVDPVDLQEDMLRFADNFVNSTSRAAELLERDGHPINRKELLTIKVALASDAYGLAAGSNALANMVSLVVLTSGARWRVHDYWLPKIYGKSAEPMLKTLEAREENIWAIARRVLKPQMLAELRQAVEQWRKSARDPEGELEAFASNSLVNEVTKGINKAKQSSSASSVFSLLDIDPLAGLDPATRELTETRLFAERALFIGQRMPQLLEWQIELLAMRSTAAPQVAELISGTTQLAAAGDRISRTAEQLPGLITAEREKLVGALKTEQHGLGELSRNFGQTFTEGGRMAANTGEALKTFKGILTQLDSQPSDPNSPPFEIKDYATTAQEINRMSLRLTELLKTFQVTLDPVNLAKLSAAAETLTRNTQERGQAMVNYAFRMGLLLVALSTLIVLAGGLLYRWLGAKIRTAQP